MPLQMAMACQRIFNIIDTKPLIIEKQNNKDIHLQNDTTYNVKFSNVTFAYESSNKNILSNINLNIKRRKDCISWLFWRWEDNITELITKVYEIKEEGLPLMTLI